MNASFHALQWAVSHNSYLSPKGYSTKRLYDDGFRGIELDIVRNGTKADWCVTHNGNCGDPGVKDLAFYLDDIRSWSMSDALHEPLFLHIDCKDVVVGSDFPDAFDAYMRDCLPDYMVFSPIELMSETGDLMQNAMRAGWPTMASLSGLVIPVLTGSHEPKEVYAATRSRERFCFADRDLAGGTATNAGTRVIANCQRISQTLLAFGQWMAKHQGLLWRVYQAKTLHEFVELCGTGANMVAADDAFDLPVPGYWKNPVSGGGVEELEVAATPVAKTIVVQPTPPVRPPKPPRL